MSDFENQNDEDSGFYDEGNKAPQADEKQDIEEQQPAKDKKKKSIKKTRKQRAPHSKKAKEEKKNVHLKNEGLQIAEGIIEKMKKIYRQDMDLTKAHKLANKKIIFCKELEKQLRNIYICDGFLQLRGLSMFEDWLTKAEGGVQPSLTLKLRLFKILLELNVQEQHISYASQLQKIIHKNKRSMVKDLRELSDAIVTKWSRITYDDINE